MNIARRYLEAVFIRLIHSAVLSRLLTESRRYRQFCLLLNGKLFVCGSNILGPHLGVLTASKAASFVAVKNCIDLVADRSRILRFPDGQFLFTFSRKLPPRFLWAAFHEPNGGDERVEQARIVSLA